MDDREYLSGLLVERLEDKVRKRVGEGPPDVCFNFMIEMDWVEFDRRAVQFFQEPQTNAFLLFFLGEVTVENVRFRLLCHDELAAHPFKIRRLTSAHGDPALGFARYAASLFRRRCRVISVSSIFSGHSATHTCQ